MPRPGLSIPLVTIVDRRGQVLVEDQRALVRFALQDGMGADILFAAGTTGEWDRLDNRSRQLVSKVVVEECRSTRAGGRKVEAWVGITAHTRSETLDNLAYALAIRADAAVLAPLSVADLVDPVRFLVSEVGELFQKHGRYMPLFLYDNADIAAPGHAPHLRTRDLKRMSRLDFVRGIKVTASKQVLGNYTKAASHFKRPGEFAIYVGNAHLIFDLFAMPTGLRGRLREYWNRFLTRRALPAGVVAGPANVMPREWQRAWQACRAGDEPLMGKYAEIFAGFRAAAAFLRSGRPYRPAIACLKAGLVERGVCSSDAVAPGTHQLEDNERAEFIRRYRELERRAEEILEPRWLSRGEDNLRAESRGLPRDLTVFEPSRISERR